MSAPDCPGTFVVNGSPTKTEMVDGAGGKSQVAAADRRADRGRRPALPDRRPVVHAERRPGRGGPADRPAARRYQGHAGHLAGPRRGVRGSGPHGCDRRHRRHRAGDHPGHRAVDHRAPGTRLPTVRHDDRDQPAGVGSEIVAGQHGHGDPGGARVSSSTASARGSTTRTRRASPKRSWPSSTRPIRRSSGSASRVRRSATSTTRARRRSARWLGGQAARRHVRHLRARARGRRYPEQVRLRAGGRRCLPVHRGCHRGLREAR